MKRIIEDVDSITAREVGKALPEEVETGRVELETSGVGIQEIDIVSTPGRYGGFLRWFVCPGCGRRVGKLYLPTGKWAFLCRHCHKLGYQAQFSREFRKAGPNEWKTKREERTEMLRRIKEVLKDKDKREELIRKLTERFMPASE